MAIHLDALLTHYLVFENIDGKGVRMVSTRWKGS